jgi:hypothetical protein
MLEVREGQKIHILHAYLHHRVFIYIIIHAEAISLPIAANWVFVFPYGKLMEKVKLAEYGCRVFRDKYYPRHTEKFNKICISHQILAITHFGTYFFEKRIFFCRIVWNFFPTKMTLLAKICLNFIPNTSSFSNSIFES